MTFFKKIFNDIKDRDSDDDTVKVKGREKAKYYGTVVPYLNFSAKDDAAVLQNAIEAKGVDEDVIISVLAMRSNEQRQKIKVVYEATTGESLSNALKSALRSDLEDVTLALLMTPAVFDAYLLRKATKGLGTHEHILVEILATRTNEEILEIKRVFKEEYERELEDVIKDETSGDFTTALLAMLKANKSVNTEVDNDLAKKDAEILFEAGENASDTNVTTFIDILTTRSGPQLSKTFQQYACLSDITLPKALDLHLKGDIEDCLIDIVKCAWNTPAFFAQRLHQAMKGHGTCEETLIRVLVSRSEVDLKKILEQYRAMFDVSLQEHIAARDEEKNRRNNTDSTNQVMKDLEDLLPNRSLIPPAPPEPEMTPEPEPKPTKMKPGSAGKGVKLQKDVALASPNPNAREPVSRSPGPRGPGAVPGPGAGPGRGRGRAPPPR